MLRYVGGKGQLIHILRYHLRNETGRDVSRSLKYMRVNKVYLGN
jgi:hypothetical protein